MKCDLIFFSHVMCHKTIDICSNLGMFHLFRQFLFLSQASRLSMIEIVMRYSL